MSNKDYFKIKDVEIKKNALYHEILNTFVLEQEYDKEIKGIRFRQNIFIDFTKNPILLSNIFKCADFISDFKCSVPYMLRNSDYNPQFIILKPKKPPSIILLENSSINNIIISGICYVLDNDIRKNIFEDKNVILYDSINEQICIE
jgi:hypothetical protein